MKTCLYGQSSLASWDPVVALVLCGVAGWRGLAVVSVFPVRVIIFLRYKESHILSNLYKCRTDPLVCVDAMTMKMMPFEH